MSPSFTLQTSVRLTPEQAQSIRKVIQDHLLGIGLGDPVTIERDLGTGVNGSLDGMNLIRWGTRMALCGVVLRGLDAGELIVNEEIRELLSVCELEAEELVREDQADGHIKDVAESQARLQTIRAVLAQGHSRGGDGMTTATAIRVPVRTWQEKAILTAALCAPLAGLWEGFDGHVGGVHEQLYSSTSTDEMIDEYFNSRPEIESIEGMLRSLREITPGSDAALEISGFPLLKELDEELRDLVTTDVEELHNGSYPSRREIAEAIVIAIDLLEEITGGDA